MPSVYKNPAGLRVVQQWCSRALAGADFPLTSATLATSVGPVELTSAGAGRLRSDPSVDIDSLRNAVVIKPGDPYSEKKVQESVEALKKTGQFKNVEIEIKPETNGLRVILVLEPAFYYGVLTFPGSRAFSYVRLLQVANLPEQEPFIEKDVEKARKALEDFFHANGFFQAKVTASTELYEKEGLANVIFTSRLKKRAKIGTVQIQGPPEADAAHLAKVTRSWRALATGASLKSGKVYAPRRIEAARAVIKRDLVKRKFLASKIQVGPAAIPSRNQSRRSGDHRR